MFFVSKIYTSMHCTIMSSNGLEPGSEPEIYTYSHFPFVSPYYFCRFCSNKNQFSMVNHLCPDWWFLCVHLKSKSCNCVVVQSLSSENDASPIFRKLRRILAMLCWNNFSEVVSDSAPVILWLFVRLQLPPPPPPLPLPLRLLLLFPPEKCLLKLLVFEMPELPGPGVTAIPLSGVNSQSL